MVQDNIDIDRDWEAMQWDLLNAESTDVLTDSTLPMFVDVLDEAAELQELVHDINSLRQQHLESGFWSAYPLYSQQEYMERFKDILENARESIRTITSYVIDIINTLHDGVQTLVQSPRNDRTKSMDSYNDNVRIHPEKRREYCKERAKYLQWRLKDSHIYRMVQDIDVFLDGGQVDMEEFRGRLRQFENQTTIFLQIVEVAYQSLVSEMPSTLSQQAQHVLQTLRQRKSGYGDEYMTVTDVRGVVRNKFRADLDDDEVVSLLFDIHENGGREADYFGIWAYDGSSGSDASPEPQFELITENEASRWRDRKDEIDDAWSGQVSRWVRAARL